MLFASAVRLVLSFGNNGRLLEKNLHVHEPRILMLFNKQVK